MDEELKDKLDQLNEEFQNEKEIFEGNRPVENGDSVIFTTDLRNEVLLGKYAADFDCVIAQDGIPYKLSHVTNWFVIPFNYIQEKLDTEALNGRYEELCSINSVEYKKIQIEDYIEENVDSVIDSLDEDTKFLVNLFTRNVRNETETFCMKYPEGQLSSTFKKGCDISEYINGDVELEYVMLDESKAFVIYKKDNQDYQLVYDIKGFVKDELIP